MTSGRTISGRDPPRCQIPARVLAPARSCLTCQGVHECDSALCASCLASRRARSSVTRRPCPRSKLKAHAREEVSRSALPGGGPLGWDPAAARLLGAGERAAHTNRPREADCGYLGWSQEPLQRKDQTERVFMARGNGKNMIGRVPTVQEFFRVLHLLMDAAPKGSTGRSGSVGTLIERGQRA